MPEQHTHMSCSHLACIADMAAARTSSCGGGRGAGDGRRGRTRCGRGGRGSMQVRLVNTRGYLFYPDGMRTCQQLMNILAPETSNSN